MNRKIGIIGAGGLIGKQLKAYLSMENTITLIQSKSLYSKPEELAQKLEGIEVLINLAGYPVAGRWTKKVKSLIYTSRINTTRNLMNAISILDNKPDILINASAVGIYCDGEVMTEQSENFSDNYLALVVKDWEKEAGKCQELGVNLTIIRIGVVLSKQGGAYKLLRGIFKAGLGGTMGSGKQGFSFILMEDLVRAVEFIIYRRIFGIVNAVSPSPVNNKTFTKRLAEILHRPAILPVPAFVLKLIYGEGSCTILDGQKVIPEVLLQNGFEFVGNNLDECLKNLEK